MQFRRLAILLAIHNVALLCLTAGSLSAADAAGDLPQVTAPPETIKAPAFYKKFISAHGYPITGSEKVNDYALREAAYLIDQMLAHRPDVREAMIASGSRLCIIGHNEFTTDLPEFANLGVPKGYESLAARDFWDARARGTGGSQTDPFCSCGEENLLGYPGDPYSTECILIHEFAHNIHLRGMLKVDPEFDQRVKLAYEKAMADGLWKGKYASVNHHEYFAEGVQSWFDNNRQPDHDHNHVDTRAELLEYDPGLAGLCREVFGDTVIKYTKPATRLTGHLAGYDPATAPKFEWPARLEKAKAEIRRQAENRGKKADDKTQAQGSTTRTIQGWTVHISNALLQDHPAETAKASELLDAQLQEIIRVVPKDAVSKMQEVQLWFSPEYPDVRPTAEYHPDGGWLRSHKRDEKMAKGIEFTNVLSFEAETRRMPNFALHELAHAYHDRVFGFEDENIKAVYEHAKAGGKYEKVKRKDAAGNVREDRAYALTNQMEYFAECTEAYFSRNDFFPFTRDELQAHDPEVVELLKKIWGVKP